MELAMFITLLCRLYVSCVINALLPVCTDLSSRDLMHLCTSASWNYIHCAIPGNGLTV